MKSFAKIALVAIVTLLQADNIVKYNMDGQIMEFMYKDSTTSKMVTNSEDGKVEIYYIKKNSYLVSHGEEGVNVVDVNEMKAKAKEMGFNPSMYAEKRDKPKFTIKKTGKRVNVGGIKGEEWIVKGKEDGKNYETKVVVTSDKNVVKTMRAMFNSMSDMTGGMVSGDNPFEMKKGYVVIKADGMKLESFKSKSLSSNVYKLPKVTNTREAFNDRNRRSAPPKRVTKKRKRTVDTLACYDNPCCGNIAGESVVLKPALYVNKGGTGTFLVDSATCKKNALGQITEVAIMESIENDDIILLTLILDDKNNGVVQRLIDDQTDYAGSNSSIVKQEHLDVSGNKAMYIHSRNTNQQRMDVYLGNNATLSMARMHREDWRRSFEGWAEKGWISYKSLKKNVKNWNPSKAIPAKKAEPEEIEEVEDDSGISGNDVDKAVNLLKSFF
ncbi:hypothetical protein [Sulfurimonas sp.]|uniref:hypothetical protein n=1 Tax=Sulfurimonas sp. TaxID=2022749 RepID=UPI0035643593